MKRALVTGASGQDGSYLIELLLEHGYRVFGAVRQTRQTDAGHLAAVVDHPLLSLHGADLADPYSIDQLVQHAAPDEVYNLAAQTHVGASFQVPVGTGEVTGLGAVRVFEAVRRYAPEARVYQASTSELFGASPPPQTESTPMQPRSPYGAAKLYAHQMAGLYRDAHGLWVACGILFNHDSPRRHPSFLTRKVSRAVAHIAAGLESHVSLGDLTPTRDIGHARDYVDAMWRMMQRDDPDDYVIATGQTHSMQAWVEAAFAVAGLDWRDHVVIDPDLVRPAEVWALRGDASKARFELGWSPTVTFGGLVREMVEADMRTVQTQGVAA